MRRIISDFFRYSIHPIRTADKPNRREQLMQFVFKDYPAYLWQKPSLRRVLIFPFLLCIILVS